MYTVFKNIWWIEGENERWESKRRWSQKETWASETYPCDYSVTEVDGFTDQNERRDRVFDWTWISDEKGFSRLTKWLSSRKLIKVPLSALYYGYFGGSRFKGIPLQNPHGSCDVPAGNRPVLRRAVLKAHSRTGRFLLEIEDQWKGFPKLVENVRSCAFEGAQIFRKSILAWPPSQKWIWKEGDEGNFLAGISRPTNNPPLSLWESSHLNHRGVKIRLSQGVNFRLTFRIDTQESRLDYQNSRVFLYFTWKTTCRYFHNRHSLPSPWWTIVIMERR